MCRLLQVYLAHHIVCFLVFISCRKQREQKVKIECLENLEVLKELAKGYKDSYITAHLLAEYNRIAFVRLMALLNKEGIENNINNMLMGI